MTLTLPNTYDRVIVHLTDGNQLPGTYRARIVSPDNACFDRNGTAIWLTNIFEHFIPLDTIERIEVTEAYK